MNTALPGVAACPKCGGPFHVKARTLYNAMMSTANDELDWMCAKCGYTEVEHRRKADGIDDEWPASRFQSE
jgi:hypothetical protein